MHISKKKSFTDEEIEDSFMTTQNNIVELKVGKHTKEDILDVIKFLCTRLKDTQGWFVGSSAALMLYGIDIIPNDVDMGIDVNFLDEVKKIFSDYEITKNEKGLEQFIVDGIVVELCVFPVDVSGLNTMTLDGITAYVNPLLDEYEFYKKRTDKVEANREKIRLIEELLKENK